MLGPEPIGAEPFGGDHDVVAFCLDCAPDDLFGLATHIDVGSVDEVAAGVEEGVDDATALGLVGRRVVRVPEHHGAEARGERPGGRSYRDSRTAPPAPSHQVADNILPLSRTALFRARSNRGHKPGASWKQRVQIAIFPGEHPCAAKIAAMATTRRADMFTADGKPSDDDPRENGPTLGDERTTLVEALRCQRLTLEMKCSGLDAEALARRSVEPSTMSLLGLVRHLAEGERRRSG